MKNTILLITMVVLFSCQKGKYTYDASGIFEATEIIVSAEATGKIMRFEINEGAELKTEQQSGYIDTIQLHWLKMQLLSNITAVNSREQDIPKQIAAAQQQITTLKKELQRTDKLISANAANRKQRDDTEAQIALLEKQLTAQLSLLESNNQAVSGECAALFNQIAQIDDQIVKSRIVSPINGTVLAKYAEQGELTSVGKPLFKMADMKNMYLRAYVTSGQLTELKLGQPVSVYADYKDKETRKYKGTLAWISDKAEFTPKTIQTRDERANLVYAVKIAVENDGLLKIGMYADVKFTEQ